MAFLDKLFGAGDLFSALQRVISDERAGGAGQPLRPVTSANYGSIESSETAHASTATPSIKPQLWSQLDAIYNRDINWDLAGKPLDENIPPIDQWPAHGVQPLITLVETDNSDSLLFDYKQFRFNYDINTEQLSIQSTLSESQTIVESLPVNKHCRQSLFTKTGILIMLLETFSVAANNSDGIAHFNGLIARAVALGYTASPLLHCLATALHPPKDSRCPALFIGPQPELIKNYYPNLNEYYIINNLEDLTAWLDTLEELDNQPSAPTSTAQWPDLAPIARMLNSIPSGGKSLQKKALCRTIMAQRYHIENKITGDEFPISANRVQYWELTLYLQAGNKQFIYLSAQQKIPSSLCHYKLLRSFDELYDDVIEALPQLPSIGLRR